MPLSLAAHLEAPACLARQTIRVLSDVFPSSKTWGPNIWNTQDNKTSYWREKSVTTKMFLKWWCTSPSQPSSPCESQQLSQPLQDRGERSVRLWPCSAAPGRTGSRQPSLTWRRSLKHPDLKIFHWFMKSIEMISLKGFLTSWHPDSGVYLLVFVIQKKSV